MVQIYVCVEGLDIVMRSASPHCVPAVPQPYFPFIFAKPPPLLHFHFIFAKIQKTYLSYQIVDFLHMDFCSHCELLKLMQSLYFEQWPQIHPLVLPVVFDVIAWYIAVEFACLIIAFGYLHDWWQQSNWSNIPIFFIWPALLLILAVHTWNQFEMPKIDIYQRYVTSIKYSNVLALQAKVITICLQKLHKNSTFSLLDNSWFRSIIFDGCHIV